MRTKGNWTARKLQCCTVIENDNGSRITTLPDHVEHEGQPCGSIMSQDKTQGEIDANAALIAAAPETNAERDRMKAFLEHTYEGDGNIDFEELHLALYGTYAEKPD